MREILRTYLKGDAVIWIIIVILSIVSLLSVYSSTGTLAYKYQGGNTAYYIIKHMSFLMLGIIVVFVVHLMPYKFYSRLSQLFLYIAIPLLLLTLVMGTTLNQAPRWLTLPGIGITFQTSDFAKLALIMYVARKLSLKQNNIKDFEGSFIPIVLPILTVCMLILPANFSTAAILFLTSVTLMFIGRINSKHILMLGMAGAFLVAAFIFIAVNSNNQGRIHTWKNRIENFIDGDSEGNFQAEQAKIAIVNGSFFGKGPGNSIQRNYLPHPYSDFIYAIIIEEYGFVGGFIVLFLYLILLYRAGVIIKKCKRTFPAFLTIGLAISLVFQAMINMAVTVNIFPVTGQTLPLVSMGGSSLLFTGVALGIILSVSRSVQNNQLEEDGA